MEKQQLKPHCVILPVGMIADIREQHSSASQFIRRAVTNAIQGDNAWNDGYKTGLSEAATFVLENKMARSLLVEGKPLANVMASEIMAKVEK
jgi:hypothetical protein